MQFKIFLFVILLQLFIKPFSLQCIEPIDVESPFLGKLIYHEIDVNIASIGNPIPIEFDYGISDIPSIYNINRYPTITNDGKTIAFRNGLLKDINGTFEYINLSSQKYNNDTLQIIFPIIDETGNLLLFDNYAKDYNNITIYDLVQDKNILEYTNPILKVNSFSDNKSVIDPLTASSDFKYVSFINNINKKVQYILEKINNSYEVVSIEEIPSNVFNVHQAIMNSSGTRLIGWRWTNKIDNNWINSNIPFLSFPIFNAAYTIIIDYANDNKTFLVFSYGNDQLYIVKETSNGWETEEIPHSQIQRFAISPQFAQISNDSNVVMIQALAPPNFWHFDLYIYIKRSEGSWQQTKMNAPGVAGGGILSKDGKRLYWTPVIPVSVDDFHLHDY